MTSRRTAIALAFLPGWGHIMLGREGQGLLIFTAAAVSAFTLVNAVFIYIGELRDVLAGGSAIALAGIVAYSVGDTVRLTSPLRLERLQRVRDRLLWEGMLCYLRSDDLAAEQKFLESARLDSLDVEPVLRAGFAASRHGALLEARRLLLRARRLDVELKWQWELDEELARVERRLAARSEIAGEARPEPAAERGRA